MKPRIISISRAHLWTIAILLLLVETYWLIPHKPPFTVPTTPYRFLQGVIHVHSTYSDGGGAVDEIMKDAERAGLDFVILTDHNNSQARREGWEKRFDKADLFVESEASTPAGHCLVFFSHTEARNLSDAEVSTLGFNHFLGQNSPEGLFIAIAHPSNIKNPWNRLDYAPDGMEIVNFDSIWQRDIYEGVFDFVGTALVYPWNNFLSALRFFEIYRKDFKVWDAMNMSSSGHFGILAHDTHSKVKLNSNLVFRWPSYLKTFRLASNIVFLEGEPEPDFEARKRQVYKSIRGGNLAIVFQALYPFEGNEWILKCGEKSFRSGAVVPLTSGCEFVIHTPELFPYRKNIQLWRNGELEKTVATSESSLRLPVASPGVYRIEIWAQPRTPFHLFLRRDVPYVLYNPIYVR